MFFCCTGIICGEDDSAQLTLCIQRHNTIYHFEMNRLSRYTKKTHTGQYGCAALFFTDVIGQGLIHLKIKRLRLRTITKKAIAEETIRRLVQMLVINIVLSVLVTALNVTGLIKTQQLIFISTCAGVALSMIINLHFMRRLYYKLANKFEYYMSTYIAHLLFFVINLSVGVIFDNTVYAWLFSITKFARFSHLMMSSLTSAVIFNIVMLLSIHIAPIGMGWLVVDEDYDYED